MNRLIAFWLILAASLVGCAAPSGAPKDNVPAGEAQGSAATTEAEGAPTGTEAATPTGSSTVPNVAACERTLPAPGPAAHKEVLRILQQTRIWLNDGEEDKSRVELDCAIQLEPDNKQAACLLRGINTDMSSAQAGDSTPYIVRPGETLGSIAQRFLGDSCEFYLLSRFNKLKYPKQLAVGQTIRLPGRINVAAPPPPPPPAAAGTPAPAAPVVVKPAPVVATPKVEAPPPPEVKKPEPDRSAEVARLYRRGQEEYRRQNLAAAINAYDGVLAIDPNHSGARVGRQQAFELQEKLRRIK